MVFYFEYLKTGWMHMRFTSRIFSVFFMILAGFALTTGPIAAPAMAQAKKQLDGETPKGPGDTPAVGYPVSPDAADPDNILYLDLSTGGRVTIQLYPEVAPNHVERIKTLVRQGFYNGVIFHRVIEGFMAQTGDPTGTGTGGSDLPDLEEEFNRMPHVRGTLSMARANDPNSANSQFFIVFYPTFNLDEKYTNLGRVLSGMAYVDAVHRGEPPADPSRILQASLKSQNLPQPNYNAVPKSLDEKVSLDELSAPISQ